MASRVQVRLLRFPHWLLYGRIVVTTFRNQLCMLVRTNSGNTVLIKTSELSVPLMSASCNDFVGGYQHQGVCMAGCLSLRKKKLINFTAAMFTNIRSPHTFLPMTFCLLF